MSKKLQKAANEKDQKSILKYAKVTEEECRKEGEGHHDKTDITAPASVESGTELKDAMSTPKRKRSQVSPTHNSKYSKPSKFINMSKTPEENKQGVTQTASQHYYEKDEDNESTLSPELAKLERILSRKQTASLEGIRNEYEDGPERYRLTTEVIAGTIFASSYEEQIQIARKIPIKKMYRLGKYNS